MSVTGWAEWSEEPEAGIRIGAHSEEVLLRGKPVIEFHHGRSTQGRTSLTTQQPDKAVGAVEPDTGIRIGSVIDVILPVRKFVVRMHDGRCTPGGKTFACQ